MNIMPWRKVVKVLENHGWVIVRKKGTHFRWLHSETNRFNTTCFVEGSLEKNKIKVLEKSFGVKLK